MTRSETGDPLGDMLMKIVVAFITIIILIFFVPVSIGTFGLFLCTGCDTLTIAFVFGFLPLAAVFIVIYKIWKNFT